MMPLSVESVCNEMARKGLLPPQDIRALRQRWLHEAGVSSPDPALFGKWLGAHGHITEYQVAVLLRRRNDPLVLGPYKIRTRIARGRLVGVYQALHPNGQVVAIKVLPPARATDPQVLARFQREARLAVRLQHPNVIRTFQAGEHQGTYYLVMEHLKGETLKDVLLRRSRLPPLEAIRLIYQALQGLQHIHEQGLVHRDLEPANLMLVPGGTAAGEDTTLGCTVKIMDIGLGRALFDEEAPGTGPLYLTTGADQLGTPEYRSPEQTHDPRQADIRSDIYSLGCILYHALTGSPPFADKNPIRVVVRQATEAPVPLTSRNLSVPSGLQEVLDDLLARDPALRFSTPGQAAQELRRFLQR